MSTFWISFVTLFCIVLNVNLISILENFSRYSCYSGQKCDILGMDTLSIYQNYSTRSKLQCATECSMASKCRSFDTCVSNGYTLCRLRKERVNCTDSGFKSNFCFNYEKSNFVDDSSDAIITTDLEIISDVTTTTSVVTTESNPCQNNGVYNSGSGICTCQTGCSGTYCSSCYADCQEGTNKFETGIKVSYLKPAGAPEVFKTLCNFDYGVTYIQYRRYGNVNFNRSWAEYNDGFGDLIGDFWLGNKHIYAILNQKSYTATFRVYSAGYWNFYSYASFSVNDESQQYIINYDETYYAISNDGLSPADKTKEAKGQSFSTYDKDPTGCARILGSGWWFNSGCSASNINGPFPITWGSLTTITMTGVGLQ